MPHSRPWRALQLSRLLAACFLVALVACRPDAPSGPGVGSAPMTINAALAGTAVRALTIVVTGPAIATPIVVNVDVSADVQTATTTIGVPVGGQRTFVARGFDATGEITHEGMATVTVRPNANAPVTIRMYPKTGEVPVIVGVGDFALSISPSPLPVLQPGATQQLVATVTDASGGAVPGAVVTWGSLNPIVASVSQAGRVTAGVSGTTTLYATFQGAAAAVDLVVGGGGGGPGPQPGNFRNVAAGAGYTCAVDESFAARCWGRNDYGQLGNGDADSLQLAPTAVAGGHQFLLVATGSHHACALDLDGAAWCWGRATFGALGTGSAGDVPALVPQPVIGGLAFESLTADGARTCGVTAGGVAYCWGFGFAGQIGLTGEGTGSVVPAPSLVSVPGGPWRSISISNSVSCAVTLTQDAVCSTDSSTIAVTTAALTGNKWLSVEVSSEQWLASSPDGGIGTSHAHACAVQTLGGLMCWGLNDLGQAGTGSVDPTDPFVFWPFPVVDPVGYTEASVGSGFVCAVKAFVPHCWGRNDHGQLGDGSLVNRSAPTPVTGATNYLRVSAGLSHACGLRGDTEVFCWGDNRWGQLGDGTRTGRTAPVRAARSQSPNP